LTKIEARRSRRLGRHRFVGIIVAAPALLVPIVVIGAIGWADITFSEKANPVVLPTVSRSISEPNIAVPFAVTISVAALLLGCVCWQIIRLLDETIAETFKFDQINRFWARIALGCAALGEALSIAGILCLSWYSARTLHIGGSYFFFFGQSSAILFSGIVCGLLARTRQRSGSSSYSPIGLSVRLTIFRARVAPGIAAAALLFGAIYLIRDSMDNVPIWLNRGFSGLELFLIISFLAYLATFSRELFLWKLAKKANS
jgi:hypothetical protein